MAASSVLHDNATCCAGAASRSQRLRLDLLGGSWVVISRVISRATILITHIRGLITLLIPTPEPPSRGFLIVFWDPLNYTSYIKESVWGCHRGSYCKSP